MMKPWAGGERQLLCFGWGAGAGWGRERENLLGEEVLGNGFQEAARVVLFAHKFYFNQVV